MAEELSISIGTKEEKYQLLVQQVKALVEGETNLVANLANVSAALKQTFNFFWVGFYLVDGKELVLGPFQGSIACTRIAFGRGVCGAAWQQRKSILVPDVEQFPGHIACSSLSKSEIVIPVFLNDEVVAVLDVDSDELNDFDSVDETYLTELCLVISNCFS
ncbi:MAG: GAF domain-containing protein [Bacteroidota bacterium]